MADTERWLSIVVMKIACCLRWTIISRCDKQRMGRLWRKSKLFKHRYKHMGDMLGKHWRSRALLEFGRGSDMGGLALEKSKGVYNKSTLICCRIYIFLCLRISEMVDSLSTLESRPWVL